VSDGGARLWIAFDPPARPIGGVLGSPKFVSVANTSTANNPITVYYEPAHVALCKLTLAPGEMERCFVQLSQHLDNGYFQVIATQPVVVGGNSQVPEIQYSQNADGTFSANPAMGTSQDVPLVWQEGCPPRHGSGCPTGATSITPTAGKNVGAAH
jgi:hypothetical protein